VFATSPITVAFPAILYRKKYGTKTLLWVLDLWPESVSAASNISTNTANKFLTGMVRYIYKNVDKVLISSQGFRKSVMDKKVPENKIHYIPNWAENVFEEAKNINFEKYANVMPNGFIVMFTGNIGEAQDCESILMAAKGLKNRQNAAQIVMVGDGRKRNWLQEQAEKSSLDNIHFIGRYSLEEMPNIIAHADVLFVSLKDKPIFSLTVPAKIQSYLVSKKPVLVMLNGEGAEVIRDSCSGLTCPAGDYISLVDNITEMQKKSPKDRLAYGNAGFQYYNSTFLRRKIISDIETIMFD
jgi:glycosyltransferase involved in cell wall biosynthesis